MDPDYVIPAHWSGERFYDIARVKMLDRIVRSAVGSRRPCACRLRDGSQAAIFLPGVSGH